MWQVSLNRLRAKCAACLLLAAAATAMAGADGGLRPWTEYRTILWLGDSFWRHQNQLPVLRERFAEMGINTAMVYGDGIPELWATNGIPYYVENVVNRGLCLKWNSPIKDWDAFITTWAREGRSTNAFLRPPSLDDSDWQAWARKQVAEAAAHHAAHAPVAVNLRDELSVTISANPFDFDFHPAALAAFRAWLKTQYRDLAALNAQWQTSFASWDDVRPFSTDEIKARMASGAAQPRGKPDWQALARLKFDPATARTEPTRWNFSPWCDFRTYLDVSLARTLADLRQAAHAVDPRTPVGVEGTQMPSAFGGYDLWRLAGALDWVEPYDIGNAREIFGSFMPGRPILSTVFEKDTRAASRRLWHLLLEGDRGCIVWWSEDCLNWKRPDFALTGKGHALAPVLKEMTSPLAALFLIAEKERDPIAIHYSQPSIQVDWLLESTVDGASWPRRFSSFEASHNRMAQARESWLKLVHDLGFSPVFVSSEQITSGALSARGIRVLVMPQSYALSEREGEAIRAFFFDRAGNPAGRTLLCDGTPGLFDEHGRLRARSRLEDLIPLSTATQASHAYGYGRKSRQRDGEVAAYARDRAQREPNLAWATWVGEALSAMSPPVRVPLEARVRVHRFRLGEVRLVAFERNISYQMSEELRQAVGNEALEQSGSIEATLAAPAHAYDLRTGAYLGESATLRFQLDPWQPTLLALAPEKLTGTNLVKILLESNQPRQ